MSVLGQIIKKSAKENAHAMAAHLIRQFLERGELDEAEDEEEIDALNAMIIYHERKAQ